MKLFIAVGVAILIFLCAGFYLDMRKAEREQAQAVAAEQAAQAEKDRAAEAELEKKYEDVLNALIQNIARKANGYKANRLLVTNLTKPENLKDPARVAENYAFMRQSMPDLYKAMNGVMEEFKKGEADIMALTEGRSKQHKDSIAAAWRAVKKKQVAAYAAYFASEQDILDAHLNLMEFYANHKGAYRFNAQTGALEFRDPKDRAREAELRKAIDDIVAQQAQIVPPPG